MKQTQCMICRSGRLKSFLDLGLQPNGNLFPDETTKANEMVHPFSMSVCEDCWLVQLDEYPPPELLFSDHPYVTGLNAPIVKHFKQLSKHIIEKLDVPAQSLVIDIGANDGTFLDAFRTLGMRTMGIDPGQRTGKLAKAQGITICETFWTQETGQALRALEVRPSVITATAVFYHVPDLHDFVRGLAEVMDDRTVFVTQCVYLKDVIESVQFDHFYHEHTCIHLIRPLQELFSQHGLRMLDVEFDDVHGGSFILYVAKDSYPGPTSNRITEAINAENDANLFQLETYQSFAEQVDENCRELVSVLTQFREQGKTVYALGAPVKGSTLMNYSGIGPELVSLAVEVNQFKIGRLTPGTHIPIIDEQKIESDPDYYLVLAWNFLDHFIEKYEGFLSRGGKFIVPNPRVGIVDATGLKNWSAD